MKSTARRPIYLGNPAEIIAIRSVSRLSNDPSALVPSGPPATTTSARSINPLLAAFGNSIFGSLPGSQKQQASNDPYADVPVDVFDPREQPAPYSPLPQLKSDAPGEIKKPQPRAASEARAIEMAKQVLARIGADPNDVQATLRRANGDMGVLKVGPMYLISQSNPAYIEKRVKDLDTLSKTQVGAWELRKLVDNAKSGTITYIEDYFNSIGTASYWNAAGKRISPYKAGDRKNTNEWS